VHRDLEPGVPVGSGEEEECAGRHGDGRTTSSTASSGLSKNIAPGTVGGGGGVNSNENIGPGTERGGGDAIGFSALGRFS